MDTEISILSGLPPRRQKIESASLILGRANEVDFVLEHPEISRRHCRILHEDDTWFIEDLGSQRGTAVNGKRIDGRTPIQVGDRIVLGPVTLGFGTPPGTVQPVSEPVTADEAVLWQGRPAEIIPLTDKLVFGRSEEVDVFLNDPVVSRRHAQIENGMDGYIISDLHSKTGAFVNGRRFDRHNLVIGDQIQIGAFYFVFNGRALHHLQKLSVGRLVARNLERRTKSGLILKRANFVAEPGQFIGILGPSGAGKTTLLNALSGLRPADSGQILVDDVDYYSNLNELRSLFGYVPQDDIVHSELTVTSALTFAARLRLAAHTPPAEIDRLVQHTIANLGLGNRSFHRIAHLSGGQRKRVSVGVELLSRPPLLFLDEPTSGLDPLAEFKLMELLRRLADTGCTVICTTHVMENVYLMDQISILVDGRSAFQGPPDSARVTFGVARLSGLYDALQGIDPKNLPEFQVPPPLPADSSTGRLSATKSATQKPKVAPRKKAFSLPILLQRQLAIFCSDPKNFLILLAQPVVIGALVAWATRDAALVQFFAYIATLWFGCNNAAQEIVRELPIYRRECLVGLSRVSYLASKFFWMGSLTLLQSLLLYLTMAIGEFGFKGEPWLQVAGLVLLSLAATGIGLTISTFARSAIQAVMLVPLILIPQILLSGFTVQTSDMPASVLAVSKFVPSFAAERISDSSFILGQRITGDLAKDYPIPYYNLNQWYRDTTGNRLKTGTLFSESYPLVISYLSLAAWILAGFCGSYLLLSRRERE